MSGIKRIADSMINYRVSTISLRTGAQEYQQRVQFVYSEASQALSAVGTVAAGAIMGGPVGAGLAAVGVGVTYLMKAIGWAQNADRLRMEQDKESISIAMQDIRAGFEGRRSE